MEGEESILTIEFEESNYVTAEGYVLVVRGPGTMVDAAHVLYLFVQDHWLLFTDVIY